MADALRGVLSLWGTHRFSRGLIIEPVFMIASVVVITLLTGAIWGWLLYSNGFINGGGFLGLIKGRKRKKMENREKEERENESPAPEHEDVGKPGSGSVSTADEPAPTTPPAGAGEGGVGEGPGK